MKKQNLFSLFLLVGALAPAPAMAGWGLFDFLAGMFAVKNPQSYNTCMRRQGQGDFTCVPPGTRVRLNDSDLQAARDRMYAAGLKPESTNRNCTTYRNGCMNCPGPEHLNVLTSPGGHKIVITKAKQNRLQPGIIKVLERLADRKGRNVTVNSAYRSCDYQASTRQGVKKSVHLLGSAADFVFEGEGTRSSALATEARKALDSLGWSNLGGTGTYCSGFAHVDTGSKRQWDWRKGACGRRRGQ